MYTYMLTSLNIVIFSHSNRRLNFSALFPPFYIRKKRFSFSLFLIYIIYPYIILYSPDFVCCKSQFWRKNITSFFHRFLRTRCFHELCFMSAYIKTIFLFLNINYDIVLNTDMDYQRPCPKLLSA